MLVTAGCYPCHECCLLLAAADLLPLPCLLRQAATPAMLVTAGCYSCHECCLLLAAAGLLPLQCLLRRICYPCTACYRCHACCLLPRVCYPCNAYYRCHACCRGLLPLPCLLLAAACLHATLVMLTAANLLPLPCLLPLARISARLFATVCLSTRLPVVPDAKPPEKGAPATAPHPPNGENLATYQREGPVGPRAGRRCSTAAGSVAPAAQRLARGSRLPLPPGGGGLFPSSVVKGRRHAGSNRILERES